MRNPATNTGFKVDVADHSEYHAEARTTVWGNPARALAGLVLLLLAGFGTACRADATSDLAGKVIEALGGRARLAAVGIIETTSDTINFGAMTNYAAGGPPIHLSDSDEVALWAPLTQRFRVHARLKALVPFPGNWDFEEAHDGAKTTRRGPSDYRPGNGASLPAAYLGARLKRLWLDHPQWLFPRATAITPDGVRIIGGKSMPVLRLKALDETWRLAIDPDSFLPRILTLREEDGLRGQILIEMDYSDWRRVAGVMIPFRISQATGGALSRRQIRTRVKVDAAVGEDVFRLAEPDAVTPPDSADVAWGWRMSHWFLGREAMGRSSETRRRTPAPLRQIGDGIFQVTGTTHHNLVIVGTDALAVVEAPFYPARSEVVLDALRRRWPDKPVRYLVLTHHHTDHVGGFRSYVEAGARLVVPTADAAFFEGLLAATDTPHEDIIAVRGRARLPDLGPSGSGPEVALLTVPNSHAFAMIAVYIRDQKLLFATDIYSPGRPRQPPHLAGELRAALRYFNVDVARLIGGHGTGPDDFSRFMEFAQ